MSEHWGTSRIEAFSDGVFAIAITLLILEIGVPRSDFDDLWAGIADQWPSYLAYATSFLTIGGLWMAHHGLMRRLAYANSAVMRLNLLLLMAVAFLPFPTKLLAEAIHRTSAERAAVVFYGFALFAVSALITAMWRYVARRRELLEAEVAEGEIERLADATTPSLAFYAVIIALAIAAPQVAALGYLLVAIVAVLRARGEHEPALK
jgi:uncharacterized membrane protein